ncbi:MAG TPA: arylamine N-acetyltransferase, partial [Dehalococcoidia bacterium]|nr:arylamine N-acetyltransferase [Dehalococcoidia bacterium]
GSHQAIVIRLDGREWLVDCGNGAPFGEPIPLDGPFELHRAGLSYRFRGNDGERWQDRLIDGEWQPFCRYVLAPASDKEREAAYQRHHVLPAESFVVEELRVIKTQGDEVLQLAIGMFTRHTPDGKQRRPLTTVEDYEEVLAQEFGMPNLPIRDGLRALQAITGKTLDAWAFG